MDSAQAAEFLGCSKCHVQGLARDGIIPANRAPNGRWKFSRPALVAWASGLGQLRIEVASGADSEVTE
ncbi:helix-turn-helix domain-containing protein [Ferrimicrobium sp.]|uniref:helix-turn-helix domain-containing protein n=1 Tax=Ferrimicrobium sp. TaxID=2926050 RepID=UPI00345C9EB7